MPYKSISMSTTLTSPFPVRMVGPADLDAHLRLVYDEPFLDEKTREYSAGYLGRFGGERIIGMFNETGEFLLAEMTLIKTQEHDGINCWDFRRNQHIPETQCFEEAFCAGVNVMIKSAERLGVGRTVVDLRVPNPDGLAVQAFSKAGFKNLRYKDLDQKFTMTKG